MRERPTNRRISCYGLNIEWSADDLVIYSCNGDLYNDICQVVRRWMDMDSGANRNTDRDEDYLALTLAENGVLPMANTPTINEIFTMQQQNAVFQQLIVLLSKRLLCLHRNYYDER